MKQIAILNTVNFKNKVFFCCSCIKYVPTLLTLTLLKCFFLLDLLSTQVIFLKANQCFHQLKCSFGQWELPKELA